MHNSQNGNQVARGGSGVGWGGGGQLTGGSPSAPMKQLLVSSCVGCHTSTTSATIINLGSSRIPIVYNTGGYPADALAGGNFYWVAQGENSYGHNVYGIAGPDDVLTQAPGKIMGCTADSCHMTLAGAPDAGNYNRGGCQGCHVYTSHHKGRGWYRFLKGHDGTNPFDPGTENSNDYVIGRGDPQWEQPSSRGTGHNWYKGIAVPYTTDGEGLLANQTVSSFCSGCHSRFHNTSSINPNPGGAPYTSPWLRHPTDILLPNTGEYAGYDPVNNYSTEVPVAWLNPSAPARTEAVVMCLSCHRAHGSDQPDMLRWDYSLMLTGGGGSGGCFTCHTNKN